MEAVLEKVLNDHSRKEKGQSFVDFVLNVLCHGMPLTDLADVLLEIVCDKARWPRVRNSALDSFIRHCPDSPKKVEKLKQLLEDVRVGKVIDSDNELLGTLLDQLYPTDLSPSEVLHCLMERGDTELIRMYWRFWRDGILKKSSDQDVAELLHNLHRQLSILRPILEDFSNLEELPQRLLIRGLQAQGDFQRDRIHQDQSDQEEWKRQQEERISYGRSNKDALSENRASPRLLHQIARTYLGRFYNFNDQGGSRAIKELLQYDTGLVGAALQGLRGAVHRNDVPEVKEILDLKQKDKTHYLSFPFLAGLAELERSLPEALDRLNENQIRKAVRLLLLYPSRWL